MGIKSTKTRKTRKAQARAGVRVITDIFAMNTSRIHQYVTCAKANCEPCAAFHLGQSYAKPERENRSSPDISALLAEIEANGFPSFAS